MKKELFSSQEDHDDTLRELVKVVEGLSRKNTLHKEELTPSRIVWWLMITMAGIVISGMGGFFLILHSNYEELAKKEEADFINVKEKHESDIRALWLGIGDEDKKIAITNKDVESVAKDIGHISEGVKEIKDSIKKR